MITSCPTCGGLRAASGESFGGRPCLCLETDVPLTAPAQYGVYTCPQCGDLAADGPVRCQCKGPIPVFFKVDGKEVCNEELALSILLRDGVLFCNERETVVDGKPAETTVVLYVLCNDVFWWACADAEALPLSEVGRLYKMWAADKTYGSTKWCCLRRKLRPQKPLEDMMREKGAWDAALEALPSPGPS